MTNITAGYTCKSERATGESPSLVIPAKARIQDLPTYAGNHHKSQIAVSAAPFCKKRVPLHFFLFLTSPRSAFSAVKVCAVLTWVRPEANMRHRFGGSSSGRTTGSGPVNRGSNPRPPAKNYLILLASAPERVYATFSGFFDCAGNKRFRRS